ncbi:PAS domain S-box protein [Williamsia sp. M5A3_1d]
MSTAVPPQVIRDPEPWTVPELESMAVRLIGYVPATEFGVVISGTDGSFVAGTPIAAEILGLTVEQLLGRTVVDQRWSAITADGDPVAGDELPANTTLRTGRPQIGVLLGVQRGSDAAGEHTWLRVDTHLLPHDEPRPAGAVLSCFRMVDGPRAAELRLAQSERTFRMITERSHEVVGIHGLDGTWLWASPAAGRVFGRAPRELLGSNVFDLIHADDLEAANTALAALLGSSPPVTVTLRMLRADGRVLWTEVIGQLIRDRRGRPHQLQSSFREVTARIEAEQARDAAERARDAAIEVFHTVMASSPIGMALREVDGRVRRTNAALQDMLGVTDADMVGTTLVDLVHVDDRDDVASAIASGTHDHGDTAYEARLRRADGSTVWVDSRSVVLRNHDGTPAAVLEQLHDVTARKAAEAELIRRASSDALTDLLNRARFDELLAEALIDARDGGLAVTVLFCDIDRFKAVNDTRGHVVGDQLLRAIGAALSDIAGPGDIVARYGGDEFAILTRASSEDVTGMAERIRAVDTGSVAPVSISVGVASSRDAAPAQLLHDADRAMYRFKQARRDG